MSTENVEIARRATEALIAGDFDAAVALLDPAFEVHDHDIPDAGEYVGFEGVAAWQADWERSWESWRMAPEEFIDAGDRVVVVLRVNAKGRGSGVEVERQDGGVLTVQDGKLVRLDYYGSRDEAGRAAGLPV